MKFITYSDLNSDIVDNIYKLPRDFDVIVGVPRSGLLAATLIALYLNKPVLDIDSFCRREISSIGVTKNQEGIAHKFEDIHKALVVEDSVNSGNSLNNVKKRLIELEKKIDIQYLAGYINFDKQSCVDYYLQIIDEDRLFEWNYLHHTSLKNACFDIDGVLCVDPTKKENDDGKNYELFIKNAPSKLLPTREIGFIVTSRLEKYRHPTEQWLKEHNIHYRKLIMMPYDSAEERGQKGNHAEFKGEFFKQCKEATWFVESSASQASIINGIAKKPVYCVDNQTFYDGRKYDDMRKVACSRFRYILKRYLSPEIFEALRNIYHKFNRRSAK